MQADTIEMVHILAVVVQKHEVGRPEYLEDMWGENVTATDMLEVDTVLAQLLRQDFILEYVRANTTVGGSEVEFASKDARVQVVRPAE